MKRFPAALAALLTLSSLAAASEGDFAGMGDLKESLAGIRASVLKQKALPPRFRVMGAAGVSPAPSFTTQSLPPEAAVPPDVSRYLIRGVDISHYQNDVDWSKVKTDGLSFVYIKATEGADGVDEKFAANWEGARTAGLARGAYHFYNFCKTGAEQAALFVKTVPVDEDALPATIDLEQSGDCKAMPAKAAFRADLAAFVEQVRAAYGRAPVLYVNYAIYDQYFKGEDDSYKLWIADVTHQAPSMPDDASWTMWQYGWHGQVAGIPGEVDLDVFNGTEQMLASLEGPGELIVASAR